MKLHIRQWDPTTLKDGRIICLCGRRGTGKSYVMKSLMYHLRERLDFGIAMTPTEDSMDMFREHIPDSWIYPEYSQLKLDQMLRIQRKSQREKRPTKHLFVFMDDCMYDKKVLKSTTMRDLFMNGRHLKMTFCFAVQYLMDMGPDLRSQVDYVICTREMIIANKVKLWKYFFGMFERYEDFAKVMDRCTENFSTLVMDNTAKSSNIEDCIFWYRADPNTPHFKLGRDAFWKLSEQLAKSAAQRLAEAQAREAEEEERVDATLKSKRKGGLLVQVEDAYGNPVPPGGLPAAKSVVRL